MMTGDGQRGSMSSNWGTSPIRSGHLCDRPIDGQETINNEDLRSAYAYTEILQLRLAARKDNCRSLQQKEESGR
ncbi:hypothetical protein ACS0TY_004189 [Phlomoides rotata]